MYEAGGLAATLSLVKQNCTQLHRDSIHSAMNVVSRVCARVELADSALSQHVENLSTLLSHEDSFVADGALRCFQSLIDRFLRRGFSCDPLANPGLILFLVSRLNQFVAHCRPASADRLQSRQTVLNLTAGVPPRATSLRPRTQTEPASLAILSSIPSSSSANISTGPQGASTVAFESKALIILNLLHSLCRGSPTIANLVAHSDLPSVLVAALHSNDEKYKENFSFSLFSFLLTDLFLQHTWII